MKGWDVIMKRKVIYVDFSRKEVKKTFKSTILTKIYNYFKNIFTPNKPRKGSSPLNRTSKHIL